MKIYQNIFAIVVLCLSWGLGFGNSSYPKIYLFLGDNSPCHYMAILANKNISGAQVIYSWKRLEPQKDVYDFFPIQSDLTCLKKIHKKLFIQIQDRSFEPYNIPVPNYLIGAKYDGGIIKQTSTQGGGKPETEGWVAKQWVPAVRKRFQKLIQKLGKALDNRISGINLPETAIDTRNQTNTFCKAYFNATLANLFVLKSSFPNTNVVQYVNFFPCEWNNSKGYMKKIFVYALKHRIGIGNPDTVPFRKSQMKNSYPFFHKMHNKLALTAIAVQEPDYTYTDPKTGKKFTIPELYSFAKNYLGAKLIFWNIQEPELTEKLLPFLDQVNHGS